MRPLLSSGGRQDLSSPWWVFRTRSARDAVSRYYRRRGWYTLSFEDRQGPALHAARVWYTAPPGTPNRETRHRHVGA